MIERKKVLEGISKEAIIEEYLNCENTFKSLGEKYGIAARTIQTWVRAYRKQRPGSNQSAKEKPVGNEQELQKEIERLRLKNELLEEIIKLSEQQTGINLRKKYGPRQ